MIYCSYPFSNSNVRRFADNSGSPRYTKKKEMATMHEAKNVADAERIMKPISEGCMCIILNYFCKCSLADAKCVFIPQRMATDREVPSFLFGSFDGRKQQLRIWGFVNSALSGSFREANEYRDVKQFSMFQSNFTWHPTETASTPSSSSSSSYSPTSLFKAPATLDDIENAMTSMEDPSPPLTMLHSPSIVKAEPTRSRRILPPVPLFDSPKIKVESERHVPFTLTLYKDAPTGETDLTFIEECVRARKQVYVMIETIINGPTVFGKAYYDTIIVDDNRIMQLCARIGLNDSRMDTMSHFLFRMAFHGGGDEGQRRWVKVEARLFAARCRTAPQAARREFVKARGFKLAKPVDKSVDPKAAAEFLKQYFPFIETSAPVYRLPFEQALKLVAKRNVYLLDGWVFIPEKDVVVALVQSFAKLMQKEISGIWDKHKIHYDACRSGRCIDPRLLGLCKEAASKTSEGVADFQRSGLANVNLKAITALSMRSSPLCMQLPHMAMERRKLKGALKHAGRLQLGLYLKGIGLTMGQSLDYWQKQFDKSGVTIDKFNKEYAYAIKHSYGKEGSRKNYTPQSCKTIITGSAPPPEAHAGCPFRHRDSASLANLLRERKVDEKEITRITKLAKEKHYQIACMALYTLTHNGALPTVPINHPVHYFDMSEEHWRQQQAAAAAATATIKKENTTV
jgi:DNA primase large subunit